jgi:hypothetical protein
MQIEGLRGELVLPLILSQVAMSASRALELNESGSREASHKCLRNIGLYISKSFGQQRSPCWHAFGFFLK